MRLSSFNPKTCFISIVTASIINVQVSAQPSALKFAAFPGNPAGYGPLTGNLVIAIQSNTNDSSGRIDANSPVVNATFSITNQQYSLPTSQISTGRGFSFGALQTNSSATAFSAGLFEQMNFVSSPCNSQFTAGTSVAPGTGIDVNTNRAVTMFLSAKALANAGASTGGRYYFGDLTITFNQKIANPVLHIVGLGGYYHSLGFTAELELQTRGIVLSKLSGSSELTISSGTRILNSSNHPGSSTGSGAASGSVLASGAEVSSLTFKVYLRGDGNDDKWSDADDHQGDVFLIGISFNAMAGISETVFNGREGLLNDQADRMISTDPGKSQRH